MNKPLRHALTLNGRDPSLLRGDPILGSVVRTPRIS